MDIPNDVIDVSARRLWFHHVSDEWADTAPEIYHMCEESVRVVAPLIAEWARKEALKEALKIASETADEFGWIYQWDYVKRMKQEIGEEN